MCVSIHKATVGRCFHTNSNGKHSTTQVNTRQDKTTAAVTDPLVNALVLQSESLTSLRKCGLFS